MKKRFVLLMITVLLWTTALAEPFVPMTVADIPFVPEYRNPPAFTLTYENDRYVVRMGDQTEDWFIYGDTVDEQYIYFAYDEEQDLYVPERALEESIPLKIRISFGCYDCGHWIENEYTYMRESGETFAEVFSASQIEEDFPVVFWDWDVSTGALISWTDYLIGSSADYDESGNVLQYSYSIPYDLGGGFVDYNADGTLTEAFICVTTANNETNYMYHYDKNAGEYWSDPYTNEPCDPPAGYNRAKIYELYPPLIGGDNVLTGDANRDGKVGLLDLVDLIRNVSGDDVSIIPSAADVNNDSAVDQQDILLLVQYLAGWYTSLE